MLGAFAQGLAFIIQKPGIYITALILALVQSAVFFFADPYLQPLVELGTLSFVVSDPLAGMIALVALVLNATQSIYIMSWVSQQVHSAQAPALGMNALRASIVVLLFGGAWVWVLNALGDGALSSNGIVALGSVLGGIAIGIITLFALIKWMFVFSYMGLGSTLKEALAQSWHFTQGKWFHAFVFGLVLLGLTTLLGGIQDIVAGLVGNEFATIGVAAVFQGFTAAFGAAALGFAIQENVHGKKFVKHERRR